MKQKRMKWTYGMVMPPLDEGKRARYFQNGMLKVTEKVIRVMEQAEDHVMFETEGFCYCIAFHRAEENVMALAA